MVKTLVSMLCVAVILLGGAIYETNFIHRQFKEFSVVVDSLYEKVEREVATQDDVYVAQKNWLDKKSYLHTFIPHNEIKEMELWLSESATLVKDKKWEDALSKLEVLKELAEQIPKTFTVSFSNIL